MELRDIARPIWQRRWIVLVVFIATLALAVIYLAVAPKKYESTATLAFTPRTSETPSDSLPPSAVASLLETYAVVAKSESITKQAETNSKHGLAGTLSTSPRLETGILEISDRASSPRIAAQTVSAVSAAFIKSLQGNGLVRAQVVDPAKVERSPVSPRRTLVIAIAIFLGLIAGCMAALALNHFRRRLRTATDVAEVSELPVLTTLPHAHLKGRGKAKGQAEILESMRMLRTNLALPTERSPQSFLITSSATGEGKTTVVANLGVALSQIGVSTTILDADLRRPMQHAFFNLDNSRGLSTILQDWHNNGYPPPVEPQPTVNFGNLSVLTAGPDPGAATELLTLRIRDVIAKLLSLSAVVLIDSPALLPYADARIISAEAKTTLLVVNARKSRPEELREAIGSLRISKGNIGGLVLTQADGTKVAGEAEGAASARV